ncbi:kinesin light chain 1 [Apiospora marii]|uniref:Kinesin light chain 1 n=1 Tax=Apiospora marii TaxID=335849 RepID=A0ABR1R3W5_9PEZI
MSLLRKLRREDYHVAWIAPVSNLELLPARLMLDEKHDVPDYDTSYDDNIYTCGSMVGHNVVIASCPPGLIGNVNAGQVAGSMFKTFANIRMALLVGIGGGVPRSPNSDRRAPDVRLGDVVVGWPGDGKPACVYYDFGKRHTDGRFEMLVFCRELLRKIPAGKILQMQGSSETQAPFLVPFVRNAQFAGRESQLQRLKRHVEAKGCQSLAVHGLGGCGKTALVAELAYRLKEEDPGCAIFWVLALNAETFQRAYLEIGVALGIPQIRDSQSDDDVDVKSLVKEWLSRDQSRPWLMIIDNADDAQVLLDSTNTESRKRLLDYLPRSNKGAFIFTTRSRKAAVDVANTAFELPQLTGAEGVEFIKKRLSGLDWLSGDAVVARLLGMLTYLPLAIVQAVAFINKNGISLQNYIDLFWNAAESELSLLKEHFEDQTRYQIANDKRNNAVAITWRLSFNRIRTDDPLAAKFLGLMACLQRENIPTSVFRADDAIAKTKALGTLKAYAFITARAQHARDMAGTAPLEEETYDMHRLVQMATQDWLKDEQEWVSQLGDALSVLVDLIPLRNSNRHDNWRVWMAYIPHGVCLASLCSDEGETLVDRVELLRRIGRCQHTLGQYRAAEEMHREALALSEELYGTENWQTLQIMHDIGCTLDTQSRYAEAETIFRQVLLLSEKVKGKEHRDTLTAMNCLGSALRGQRRYAEAEIIFRETLVSSERVLGKEHRDTLASMNNLGLLYEEQGKHAEAEVMFRRILILDEKVDRREHPDALTTMHNLGNTLYDQRRYAEAEAIYRETLILRKKVIGEHHPETLGSMHQLGLVLRYQGKYTEAEKIYRETLELDQRVLGKEHPDTLKTMHPLGVALNHQERYTEAEKTYREALVLQEKVLGTEHRSTLRTTRDLAGVLRIQGKLEEAELLLSRIPDL